MRVQLARRNFTFISAADVVGPRQLMPTYRLHMLNSQDELKGDSIVVEWCYADTACTVVKNGAHVYIYDLGV